MYYRIIGVQLMTKIILMQINRERKQSMKCKLGFYKEASTGAATCQKDFQEMQPLRYCMPRPQYGICPRI